ncbi:MAG: adenylyl-sulfate kinase [Gammaproteobacteria bacterium]|nr:adenylyl-sulfate kinase [Gammaproteobacteria bacterium]
MKTILVFGLPGSGKTTFAKKLSDLFRDRAIHFNGDEFRKAHNDWDFSEDGRRRQAERMRDAAINAHREGKYAILDFVCPKEEYRKIIDADFLVYMRCVPVRNFADTTAIFEKPERSPVWAVESYEESDRIMTDLYHTIMESVFNPTSPTGLMIGRFQPFHDGHKALFLKALEKHGQVCVAIRDMPQSENNPYTSETVERKIHTALQEYRGRYKIVVLPNIVDVIYGRDVGWTVSKIDLPPEIEAISGTEIRQGR